MATRPREGEGQLGGSQRRQITGQRRHACTVEASRRARPVHQCGVDARTRLVSHDLYVGGPHGLGDRDVVSHHDHPHSSARRGDRCGVENHGQREVAPDRTEVDVEA